VLTSASGAYSELLSVTCNSVISMLSDTRGDGENDIVLEHLSYRHLQPSKGGSNRVHNLRPHLPGGCAIRMILVHYSFVASLLLGFLPFFLPFSL
jgi:hypothetical protein